MTFIKFFSLTREILRLFRNSIRSGMLITKCAEVHWVINLPIFYILMTCRMIQIVMAFLYGGMFHPFGNGFNCTLHNSNMPFFIHECCFPLEPRLKFLIWCTALFLNKDIVNSSKLILLFRDNNSLRVWCLFLLLLLSKFLFYSECRWRRRIILFLLHFENYNY